MKKIGFVKYKKNAFSGSKWCLYGIYTLLLVLSFSFFSFYTTVTGWFLKSNKIDIFHDLKKISWYFWMIDPKISEQLLIFDDILKEYLSGANVLQSKEKELTALWDYAQNHKEYLIKLGFKNYERILQMLVDARPLREEIFQLLGKNQRFNYLVPLQNSNESRPNGGFFGSFAFVSFSGGHVVDMQILDSYLPNYLAPKTYITLPEWMQKAFGWIRIGFISGNRFGFTDKDGKNLKILYEKIFHTDFLPERKNALFQPEKWNQLFQKYIKGIIFLDSELITYLMPAFRSKAREWQFINANIDLIRGKNEHNKKVLYIKDLEQYLQKNSLSLAKSTINTIQDVLHKGFVNIYLSNVSDGMWSFLKKYDLTTVYHPDFLYFWSENTSYNKADGFLSKKVEIQDTKGKVILSTEEKKLSIASLASGTYTLALTYTLDIPQSYKNEMHSLEKKYHIQMTDREKFILALQDHNDNPELGSQRWASKEIIHFPFQREILDITGDCFQSQHFSSDFSRGVTFSTKMLDMPQTNTVYIKVRVP